MVFVNGEGVSKKKKTAQDHKANVNRIEIETYIHSCDICIDP